VALSPADTQGSGDSQLAAIATALADRQAIRDALRLGMAAGAINVVRHGLGSGDARTIRDIATRIELTALRPRRRPPLTTADERAHLKVRRVSRSLEFCLPRARGGRFLIQRRVGGW
jgi:bifunctional ADP-heptose synthase (sugar kinase/adenylyltransferase)